MPVLQCGTLNPRGNCCNDPRSGAHLWLLLGGSWDLETVYKWLFNPSCGLPKWPSIGYPNYKQGYTWRNYDP